MRRPNRYASFGVVTAMVVLCTLTSATAASAATTPAAGIQIKIANTNKCLNVDHDSLVINAAILQYTCGDSFVNDKFRVRPVGAGQYQIIGNHSNMCLNVKGGLVAPSTPVVQYTCNNTSPNNLWSFVPVVGKPTFRIVSKQSGLCLNVSKGTVDNNLPLIIYTCTAATTPTNDQFYFPPAASPAPVPAAVVTSSPMAAAQGKPTGAVAGPIVYAYLDNGGRLRRAYQPDPSNFGNIVYTSAGSLEQYAGHAVVSAQADGRVQVAARNAEDGDLWLTTQTRNDTDTFTAAQDVGGAGAGQPVVGKLPDGKLVTFALVGGSLWHLPQDGTNLPYGAWRQVGGSNLTGEPTVVTIRDGLRLFALNTSGSVMTATYRNGLLSDWVSLGAEKFTGKIAAAVFPGYRTRVVVRDAEGLIVTKTETATDVFASSWTQVGDFAAAGDPATVMDDATGSAAIVARGADGLIHMTYETAQASGTFADWRTPFERVVVTDPTILTFIRPSDGGLALPAWGWVVRDLNEQPLFVSADLSGTAAQRATKNGAKGAAKVASKPAFKENHLPAPPK
jgi:hypothetical protein